MGSVYIDQSEAQQIQLLPEKPFFIGVLVLPSQLPPCELDEVYSGRENSVVQPNRPLSRPVGVVCDHDDMPEPEPVRFAEC